MPNIFSRGQAFCVDLTSQSQPDCPTHAETNEKLHHSVEGKYIFTWAFPIDLTSQSRPYCPTGAETSAKLHYDLLRIYPANLHVNARGAETFSRRARLPSPGGPEVNLRRLASWSFRLKATPALAAKKGLFRPYAQADPLKKFPTCQKIPTFSSCATLPKKVCLVAHKMEEMPARGSPFCMKLMMAEDWPLTPDLTSCRGSSMMTMTMMSRA